ncbi:hypothetical protein H0H81_008102 [Sphagnurus paluster]|uniref:Uncharacterized protein n=1 Tax=Sphagnurus paluster TaxID=117069 RepID=A0A9P7FWL6_9AGAR|nr:hypothetical protein H0H81_008102 [Sphagnurus paluster]
MSKPINTCVLGVGLAGLTFHVPFILALPEVFTLHSVLERNPQSSGGKVHDRFGVTAKIHRTLEQVLEDPEIELVIVGTPNQTHYAFAKAALEAGKHVLVDKPVTATVEQAKELGALARSKGLVLYGFQNRRWDSDFLALKRLLALPETSPQYLGTLVEFESQQVFYSCLKGTWKDEPLPAAGQTFDLGSHLIDQALTLFGRPEKLTAFIQNIRGVGSPEVDDTFTIHFHYPMSPRHPYPFTAILRGHILSIRSPQLRYLVRGTQGTYVKYGLDIQEDQLKVIPTPQAVLEEGYGKEPEAIWGTVENIEADDVTVRKSVWPSADKGQYIELFKNLGAAIRKEAEPAVKWEEATAVIEMIELAHRSSREGSPDEPRIIHLAVHPSAWSSSPPEIPPPTPTHTPQPSMPRRDPSRPRFRMPSIRPVQSPHPLSFILAKHQAALAALSRDYQPQPLTIADQAEARAAAVQAVERHGWTWPDILDEEYPPATEGGLKYERVTHNGRNFLSLVVPSEAPTPLQLHAFKVLTYTFTLLSIPASNPVHIRSVPSQTMPIPPNVNQLLQQLGLPQLRPAPNQNANANANANQVMPALRQMPLRPLLAPLLMLVFRTMLLLYFVAPARKPIFGILILAWMLYEIWRPIRRGLMRGLRAAENQQRANPDAQQQQQDAPAAENAAPHAQNVHADGPRPAQNGAGGIAAANLDMQAGAVLDALANRTIAEEERILNEGPGAQTAEPSFSQKALTLVFLFLATIHPAVWNRRRVALGQREGRIRTEANIRNVPDPAEGETENEGRTQLRDELRAQYNRRPRWVREYMDRVVAGEWVDDSD